MLTHFIETLLNSHNKEEINNKLEIVEQYENFPDSHLEGLREKAGENKLFKENPEIQNRLNELLEYHDLKPVILPQEDLKEEKEIPFKSRSKIAGESE